MKDFSFIVSVEETTETTDFVSIAMFSAHCGGGGCGGGCKSCRGPEIVEEQL